MVFQAFGPSCSVADAYKFAAIYYRGCDMLDIKMRTRSGWSRGPSLLPRRYIEFETDPKRQDSDKTFGSFGKIVRIYEDEVATYLEQVIALKTTKVTLIDDQPRIDAVSLNTCEEQKALLSQQKPLANQPPQPPDTPPKSLTPTWNQLIGVSYLQSTDGGVSKP